MESVSQTLAGRTALVRLYPLSLAELLGRPPVDAENLDGDDARHAAAVPDRSLWTTLVDGFYPRIHDRGLPAGPWLADYVRTYIERDLREVMQVSDLRSFERFMRLAASHTAQELNLTALASDAGVTRQTAGRWLAALEIGFLATNAPTASCELPKATAKASPVALSR